MTPTPPSTLKNPALKNSFLWRTQAYINGAFVDGDNGLFAVDNPATEGLLAQVANTSTQQTQAAINHAQAAWLHWRELPAKDRAAVLKRWYEAMVAHSQDLAHILSLEQGKPLAEAHGEVLYAASFVEWFAEQAKRIQGAVLESPQPQRELLVFKQSIGVCAAITPWNFPLAMVTRKVAPALAAGCTVLLKPAEQTPLCALALAQLGHDAGLPAGVFNVLTADAAQSVAIGQALCASPVVRKLSFTGSTEVGRLLMQQCAPSIKKLSLELGGHAPFIVFADANLEAAADGLMAAKFRNAGQTCVSANRIYVHHSVLGAFTALLHKRMAALKVGPAFNPNSSVTNNTIGPLIDAQALAKVQAHVDDAKAQGGMVLLGGTPHRLGGHFYAPTLIAMCHADMRLAQEETFGPVAALFAFDREEDVLQQANNTPFGLAAYFYTENLARSLRVARALEYGMVGVNVGGFSNEVGPFGGIKQSGLGREGSVWGLDEFLEMKYVCVGTQP